MGVEVRILGWAEDEEAARRAACRAFERIAAIEDVASDWRASSEVSRLCAGAVGVDVPVSDDLFEMLACARQVSMASGGGFDVTIGAVTHVWRAARAGGRVRSEVEVRAARARVGWRGVVLDPERHTARLARAGIEIDLGGIAQGFAAAEALEVMDGAGLGCCVVDVSGDIAVGDAPPGQAGWRVAVPTAEGWQALVVARCAVSTSGDGEQFVMVDGRRESHIVRPVTGHGVVGMRSVTIVGASAMMCDAMATAVSVLGEVRGVELVERAMGLEALVVVEAEEGVVSERRTSGFAADSRHKVPMLSSRAKCADTGGRARRSHCSERTSVARSSENMRGVA